MAIDELGFSLLGRAEEQRRQRRRDEDRADKYAIIGGLTKLGINFANKAMEKKANSWQQDEQILANQRNYKRAYDSGADTINEWDTASKSIGGVGGYLRDKVRPGVRRQFDLEVQEDRLMDKDAYNREIEKRVNEIVGTQDGEGLYNQFYKARQAALKLSPDSDYNAFIEAKNPAYRNVEDAIFGSFSKEKPDRKAYVSSVLESKFSQNSQAYNAALDAYQQGLSSASAVKLGEVVKEQFELKPEEKITSTKPRVIDIGGGRKIVVTEQQKTNEITGAVTTTFSAAKGDEVGNAFLRNQLIQTEDREVVDPYTGVVTTIKGGINVGGAVLGRKVTGVDPDFTPPSALGEVTEKTAQTVESNFVNAFLSKPDGKDRLDEFRDSITLGEEGMTESRYKDVLRVVHLTSMSLQDKEFGGAEMQPPLRATQASQLDNARVANDLAAEMVALQYEYRADAKNPEVPLGQDLMSEVVGQKGKVNGPLILLGLDRLNRRSGGTYDLDGIFTEADFNNLVRSTVSVPEIKKGFESRTVEEQQYIRKYIDQSIKDSVNEDGTNSSVFMLPFREGGVPIANLFGVFPKIPERSIKVPEPVAAPVPRPEPEVEPEEPTGPNVEELLQRKERLERRTYNRVKGQRQDEVAELESVNRELASLGEDTTPIFLSRSDKKKLNSSISGLFEAEKDLKRQPAGAAQRSTKAKRLEEDIDEFSSSLKAMKLNTRASYVADSIRNIRGFKNLEQEDIEQTLFKAYNDKEFVNQVITALYL